MVINDQNDEYINSMFLDLKQKGFVSGQTHKKDKDLDYDMIHLKSKKFFQSIEKVYKVKKIHEQEVERDKLTKMKEDANIT